ncbi:putative pentatricopeptide repeat-containing protein At3g15130 [Cucurbita pepo subsp. pepo]|uniref:putative pentatricopeptide repeat-containing protein At3g15130 n=1 Tax=Cucurbita pepo subsp. pepo TaxID=3664 RepID=UPI000C9D87E9|nr:putative pentatricopeptide repeat-containing protein At3g15130 [Cucurbita pepo subsp. pepo]
MACVHGDQMHFLIWKHGFHAEVFVASALVDITKFMIGPFSLTVLDEPGVENLVHVNNSLIDMYGKCGLFYDVVKLFSRNAYPLSDHTIWVCEHVVCYKFFGHNHGHANQVVELLKEMLREEITPDYITFISVLSACSHTGRVEEGFFYFNSMVEVHGSNPGYEHYACIVDLLGRAEQLNRAKRFIELMPIKPEAELLDLYYVAYEVSNFSYIFDIS